MAPSMLESSRSYDESRIEGVLIDATNDLDNADLPDFLSHTLIPVTSKASEIVPKVASKIPLPYVDELGALALSVPLKALKVGYSLIPHEKKEEDRTEDFLAALEKAGVDLHTEYLRLNMNPSASESYKVAALKSAKITFLVEIVGCEGLAAGDLLTGSSDPFVKVKFGNKILHKTKSQPNTLDPIYTLRQDALWLWTVTMEDLFLGSSKGGVGGLALEVCDYDSLSSDDTLGTAAVPPEDIYYGDEERMSYPLLAEDGDGYFLPLKSGATIAIRVRRATSYHKEFLANYKQNVLKKNVSGVLEEEKTDERGHGIIQTLLEKKIKVVHENGENVEKFKVLPAPDPEATSMDADPMWKTANEIDTLTMQPSRNYKYIGSGKIARVYLEILSCDNLPNMETVKAFGKNKTDAFVQVVYEDCICRTDVIDDKNNPRFLPWTNRAFVLHSRFPSSVVNLGVFDYDVGSDVVQDHDFIGRAAVDLSSLRPDTEYLLDYKLYDTALLESRKDRGTIRIRVRMEVDDPRAYLLASLSLPPARYVNCSGLKDFKCIRQTVYGGHDMTKYSIATIVGLISELTSYKRFYYYAYYWVRSMLLWEDTYKITFLGVKTAFPLKSLCAFPMAVTLVEKPHLLPAFALLSVALVLLTTMNYRTTHPNPWWRCHSFAELVKVLIFGDEASLSPETIERRRRGKLETKPLEEKFVHSWDELVDAAEKNAEEKAKLEQQMEDELEDELKDVPDKDIKMASETMGIGDLRVSKKFLYPIQKVLVKVCKMARFVKHVFLWEEPLSFWVTLGCLVLSAVLIKYQVVERALWLMHWVMRIAAWFFFGPWMHYIGYHFFPEESSISIEEEEAEKLETIKEHNQTMSGIREENERLYKLRDFRQYFFGKYLTEVPMLKIDRYMDTPLSSSSSKPVESDSSMCATDDGNSSGSDEAVSDEEPASGVIPIETLTIFIGSILFLPFFTVAVVHAAVTGVETSLFGVFTIFIVTYLLVGAAFILGELNIGSWSEEVPIVEPTIVAGQELTGVMIPELLKVPEWKSTSMEFTLFHAAIFSLLTLSFLTFANACVVQSGHPGVTLPELLKIVFESFFKVPFMAAVKIDNFLENPLELLTEN